MAKTPTGVAVLALLNLLVGLLMLAGSLDMLGPLQEWVLSPGLLNIPQASLILGLFYLLLGIGLLMLAPWAWWADMLFAILNLLVSFISYPQISWIPLVINLIIVLYLNQGSIKRRFRV
ncbi:MAG: hypothetical protein C4K47_07670 [Candidatus Thorarchaeota archaeon]|nr:MAG: hypothetical protein C4K47_07670 [Candidatus Thorarchaeota archaeon]